MANSEMFLKKVLLMSAGVLFMTLVVTGAKADDRVVRSHQYDMKDVTELEISSGVGSVEIRSVSGNELRVEVEIEAQEKGFFRRSIAVDNMDIESRNRGDRLILDFHEEDVSAHWYVEMPQVAGARINLGVGEIKVDVEDTELDIKTGVGDVQVDAPENTVGRVNLVVGVGDASLRGGRVTDDRSAFISKSIRGEGTGERDIEIDVGVGDARVRLR